ncbi:MAG TPA: hypothetical protein VIH88_05245 [Candidatus Acidoferrales bacterium]
MKTLAHFIVSLLVAAFVVALAALGSGGVFMMIYDASAFDNEIFRYLPAATLVYLLFDCAAGVAAFYLVFHRLRFNRWLPRKTT